MGKKLIVKNTKLIHNKINNYLTKMLKNRFYMDKGYPFDMICLECGMIYESCFNDQLCPKCGNGESIRWILKEKFKDIVPNPHEQTIKNLQITITGTVSQ
jgi:rubrerythrin